MRKYLVIIILLVVISTKCFSQLLSYSDIKYVYTNKIENSDIYLLNKGFEFFERQDANEGFPLPSTNWAYKRDNSSNRATSFIVKSCDESNCGFVWYQFSDAKHFNYLRDFCKKNGYKIIKTESDGNGGIDYTYSNEKYRLKFSSSVNSEGYNLYFISFDEK